MKPKVLRATGLESSSVTNARQKPNSAYTGDGETEQTDTARRDATATPRRSLGSSGGAGGAASGQLVHGLGSLSLEVHERGLDLVQHLADGDAEDALSAADEVDDLVVRGAQVDRRAVAHERGARQIADAGCPELLDRGADLLQRDAGVEQALDELEHEDVAEAVEPLRSGTRSAANGGFDELCAGPVV